MARLGVNLPAPETGGEDTGDAPATLADVEDIIRELAVAADFRTRGEPALALAHTMALGLEIHADSIARIVAEHPVTATRLLDAVDGADETLIRAALERRMAIKAVASLPREARGHIAELLKLLGHDDVAKEVA
jgi:hypothetical protein